MISKQSCTVSSGAWSRILKLRDLQSTLLTWSVRMYPSRAKSCGSFTSNGQSPLRVRIGQTTASPVALLNDSGLKTRQGRFPACSTPDCGLKSKKPRSPFFGTVKLKLIPSLLVFQNHNPCVGWFYPLLFLRDQPGLVWS